MESTLATNLSDVLERTGYYLGYGRTSTSWSTLQSQTVADCWKSGLRKFYWCGYEWSFLKPSTTVIIESGNNFAHLPDDFGGFEGQLAIAGPTGQTFRAALRPVLDEEVLKQRSALPDTTGAPRMVAATPRKGTAPLAGQRFDAIVWPKADQQYTLQCRYYLLPDALTSSMPYAYGGAQHSETILEAILSCAELLKDNERGIHAAEFDRLMQVSQQLDRRYKPQTLGRNDNGSNWYWAGRQNPRVGCFEFPHVTYNGTAYA